MKNKINFYNNFNRFFVRFQDVHTILIIPYWSTHLKLHR